MYGIVNTSKSGMSSNQNKINIISNNLVNMHTTGYKKIEIEFQELVRESLDRNSYPNNSKDVNIGTGVRTTNEMRNFMQGSLKETKISSNLAIDGEGFFRVRRPDNTYAYTRNGEFSVDSTGKLVDDNGNVLDIEFSNNYNYENAKISNEKLTINKQGEVLVDNNLVGKVNLYTSVGDNDFLSVGDSLFIPKNTTNVVVKSGTAIMQGYTEMSNVNIQQEMTDLISIQRSFQLNSKGVTVADDMWSMINNLQSR